MFYNLDPNCNVKNVPETFSDLSDMCIVAYCKSLGPFFLKRNSKDDNNFFVLLIIVLKIETMTCSG